MFEIEESYDFKHYIKMGFEEDLVLTQKWHIVAGTGLDNCVIDTYNVLMNDTLDDFKFYVVTENEKFVGYFGVESDGAYLTTIYIWPSMRPRKEEFWECILPYVKDKFKAAIYTKNDPCMGFYSKMGKELGRFKMQGRDLALFEFKKGLD